MPILNLIFPIFLITLTGYLYGKVKQIDHQGVTNLILYVTSPALIFTTLISKKIYFSTIYPLIGGAFFVILASGCIVFLFLRAIKKKELTGFYLPTIFMNSSFLGYPVTLFAFGPAGLSEAIIYDISNGILIFSLGVYIVSRKGIGEGFKLPLLYVTFLAIGLNLLNIKITPLIIQPLSMIGLATIPLMLLILGYRLNLVKISHFGLSITGALIRVGFGFAFGCLFVSFFHISGLTAKIIVLMSSLPSPFNAFILSEKFNANPELAASTVTISTLLGIITIPLVLWILGAA